MPGESNGPRNLAGYSPWVLKESYTTERLMLPQIWNLQPVGFIPLLLPSVPGMNRYFQPFYQPNECGKALCVRPDVMELDELYEFPEYSRDPTMYLALRNLVLALWFTNCKVSGGQVGQQHVDTDFF